TDSAHAETMQPWSGERGGEKEFSEQQRCRHTYVGHPTSFRGRAVANIDAIIGVLTMCLI
ncbi:MAG: hypothetical protein ACLFWB_08665, partial [Armatimonadota bacterium]